MGSPRDLFWPSFVGSASSAPACAGTVIQSRLEAESPNRPSMLPPSVMTREPASSNSKRSKKGSGPSGERRSGAGRSGSGRSGDSGTGKGRSGSGRSRDTRPGAGRSGSSSRRPGSASRGSSSGPDRAGHRRAEPGGSITAGRSKETKTPSAPPTPMDEWIDEGVVEAPARRRSRGEARAAGYPDDGAGRRRDRAPSVEVPEFGEFVGPQRAKRLGDRFEQAAKAFAADRYIDARRILKPIVQEAPAVPEAQELYGLTLYRLGKWRQAAGHLETFVELTRGSVEQHPVLADCQRALGRHDAVDGLWAELREASPSAELVTEGRIVTAGSLADRGELSAAVALLAKGFRFPKKPSEHHLRRGIRPCRPVRAKWRSTPGAATVRPVGRRRPRFRGREESPDRPRVSGNPGHRCAGGPAAE